MNNLENVQYEPYAKIIVDKECHNEGTDKAYFDLHFNYPWQEKGNIQAFGENLQRFCDACGYVVYVNTEVFNEIDTVQIEIHHLKYRDSAHINEALSMIDNYAVSHLQPFES